MTVRDTSLLAYSHLRQQGLGPRQQRVLKIIRRFNSDGEYPTDREITRALGYGDPNRVRPRRKELLDQGLIVEAGKKVCPISKRTAYCWKAKA